MYLKVTPMLFRGPHIKGLADLPPGTKSCLNVETGLADFLRGGVYMEDEMLQYYGIQVHHVPFDNLWPTSQQKLEDGLHIVETAPAPIYVHCLHGVDRTGEMIAYYRVKRQGKSPDEAIQEMLDLGYHRFPYAWIWLPRFRKLLEAK